MGDNRNAGLIVGLVVVIIVAIGTVLFFARRPSAELHPTLPGNFARPAKPPGINGPG